MCVKDCVCICGKKKESDWRLRERGRESATNLMTSHSHKSGCWPQVRIAIKAHHQVCGNRIASISYDGTAAAGTRCKMTSHYLHCFGDSQDSDRPQNRHPSAFGVIGNIFCASVDLDDSYADQFDVPRSQLGKILMNRYVKNTR